MSSLIQLHFTPGRETRVQRAVITHLEPRTRFPPPLTFWFPLRGRDSGLGLRGCCTVLARIGFRGVLLLFGLGFGKLGLVQEILHLPVQGSDLELDVFGEQDGFLSRRELVLFSQCLVFPNLWDGKEKVFFGCFLLPGTTVHHSISKSPLLGLLTQDKAALCYISTTFLVTQTRGEMMTQNPQTPMDWLAGGMQTRHARSGL